MRIDGEWFECDDGFVRPIVRGEILSADGHWEPALFLIDTGADCTVFSAAILEAETSWKCSRSLLIALRTS